MISSSSSVAFLQFGFATSVDQSRGVINGDLGHRRSGTESILSGKIAGQMEKQRRVTRFLVSQRFDGDDVRRIIDFGACRRKEKRNIDGGRGLGRSVLVDGFVVDWREEFRWFDQELNFGERSSHSFVIFVFDRSTTPMQFVGEFHFPKANADGKKEKERGEKHAEENEEIDVHS